jgi:hypothetical protein
VKIQRSIRVEVTVRTAVPDDLRVVIGMRAPDQRRFRATRIEEKILEGAYSVWVTGPIVTKVGRDHSTHTGFNGYMLPEDVPTELAPLLLGPAGLRAELVAAGGEGR